MQGDEIVNSSLVQLFKDRGITVESRRDQMVALGFADRTEEINSAANGAALTWQGTVCRIDVTGRHRHRFIHNMTTCEIKALEPGQGNYGLVVNDGGKLVSQFYVDCSDEALVFELQPHEAEGTLAQLKKYIIADDVKFAQAHHLDLLTLVGPEADALIKRAGIELDGSSEYVWMDTTIGGHSCRVRRNSLRLGLPGWDVVVEYEASGDVWLALEGLGATPVGFDAWDLLRVEYGWPLTGVDFGEENIPLESDRLAATIDWDKGCYIGQEVIAMMQYRGRPNKHLGKLSFDTLPKDNTPGTALSLEGGKKAGTLGSIVSSLTGSYVSLAVIKRRHADDDATILTSCGTSGTFKRFPKFVQE